MAQLVFYDEEHKYEYDGVELPYVNKIARFVSREVYNDVYQWRMDNAAERGTKVHKTVEALLKYGSIECDDDIAGYVNAVVKWLKDKNIKRSDFLDVEKSFGDTEIGFAGTIDGAYEKDGIITIVDWKTSCTAQKRLWGVSLNGYKILWEHKNSGKNIGKLLVLMIKNDGTYKEVPIDINENIFMCCFNLHKYMETKKRKRKDI